MDLKTASACHRSGRLAEAEQAYRQILAADPTNPHANHLLGILASQTGRDREAVALLRRAVDFSPQNPEFHTNLAAALGRAGQHADAANALRTALRLRPNFPQGLNNLGVALEHLEQYRDAADYLRAAIQLKIDYAEARTNLANVLRKMGDAELSADTAADAIRMAPGSADAHNALAAALIELGRSDEAAVKLRHALRLDPTHAEAAVNLAMVTLLRGDLRSGFRAFERRLSHPVWRRPMPGVRWQVDTDPASLAGKTILLYTEGGLGNAIQFVRYVPLVSRLGMRVIIECRPALKALLQSVEGVSQIVEGGQALPPYDLYAAFMSLPALVVQASPGVPAAIPYLRAESDRVERWRAPLEAISGFRIGISWQGDQRPAYRRNRSFPLSLLEPIARLPGVQLVSLQKGAAVECGFHVHELQGLDEGPEAFLDTAAVMRHLNLVITCDTSIAHLAGALAVPTWVALPFAPDWRWMLNRDDTPWYPTMRLFRQSRRAGWDEVFHRIAVSARDLLHIQR